MTKPLAIAVHGSPGPAQSLPGFQFRLLRPSVSALRSGGKQVKHGEPGTSSGVVVGMLLVVPRRAQ